MVDRCDIFDERDKVVYVSDDGLVCVFDHMSDGCGFKQYKYRGVIGEVGFRDSVRVRSVRIAMS